ncbi:MAG: flagellar filament capping protein FliD [Janthinobacterium lividum]
MQKILLALAASTFQVNDGTSSATVTVSAGSTLADVASQINSQGLNLTASVVNDSSGSHLAVTSTTGQNVTLSADPTLALTQASQAQNASLTVDGVPVSSASNTVTGAVSGMTFDLSDVTTSAPVTLGVAADTTQINSAVSQFVTDYNSAMSLISSQFTYSSSTSSQGALGSDASVRTLQSMLLGISGYTATSSSSSSVSTLADLGITMNDDGSLSVNTSTLDQAVSTNAAGVQNFFQGTSQNGFVNQVQTQLKTFTAPSVGTLAVDVNSLTQQYNDLQTNVNNYESGYVASQKTLLTSMYSKAEIALQSLPTTLKQLQAQLGDNSGS